jgi:predicted PurR-regulated permease PerM
VFNGVAGFLIVLVLAFYIVVEDDAIKTLFVNVIPSEYQSFATQVAVRVIEKLGDWMRGQLLLGLIIGVLYFIGLIAVGVPYPLLLALFGGLVEFIPYIGPFISAIPVVFLAFTVSPMHAGLALIVIVVIQQLENNVIVPKVMQRAVGLNPIVSIIAFMVGAQLFGMIGAIFSIPVATGLSVAISEYHRWERSRTV